MKKDNYKSRSCKETLAPKEVESPIVGRIELVDGEYKFISKDEVIDIPNYGSFTREQLEKIVNEVFKDLDKDDN